ncbi:hypothetical protein AB0J83_37940 [Actinoplanes sp. NPDC049596]|uniref:SCO0607 family lipoprotein n=1 Tax=unclassified Actinoplanes TaxID=2626549 RepID=UPI00342FCB8B
MTHRGRTPFLLAAAVLVAGLTAGCSYREAICSDGESPVAAVDSYTGRACVKDSEQPPAGYVRFPEGKVPQHVDDEWDLYWNGHKLDASGRQVA